MTKNMTILKKLMSFNLPKITAQGIISAGLIFAVIGGGILTSVNNVQAAENKAQSIAQNKEKEQSVKKFMREYGVSKGSAVSTRTENLKQIEKQLELQTKRYESQRDALLNKCLKAKEQSIWQDLKDKAKNLLNEALEKGIRYFAENHYSFVSQAEYVQDQCQPVLKSNKEIEAQLKELMENAQELENLYSSKDTMEISGYGDEIYEHCFEPKNGGTKQCVQFVVNEDKNTIMSIAGASQGCMPLPFKLYEARSCLFCPLFKVIFNTIQKASGEAWAKVANPLSKLLLVGLAIWIAWMVLQNVSSMTKQDAPQFLNTLFKASFKVVIVFFLLSSATLVYHNIIGPLLKAGFEFGTSFLSVSGSLGTLPSCKGLGNISASIGGVLPQYVYQHLLCFIEAVQYELATSQAIGSSLMCISVNQGKTNIGSFARVMPDFSMMFQGALIYAISFILSISFGFYLIDATIQLGIFGVILPFLLLCYPFKITKKYFDTGVGVFMNSWFIYVFMGIIVNICMQLIGQGLTGGKGGFEAVEEAINGNEVSRLQELLNIGFSGFLILIACCLFAMNIMQKVQEIAGRFSGGGLGLNIGNQLPTIGASGAMGMTLAGKDLASKHVVKPVAKGTWSATKGAVKGVATAVRHPQRTFRNVMLGKKRRSGSK